MFGSISQSPHLARQLPWRRKKYRHIFLKNLGKNLKCQLSTNYVLLKSFNDFIFPFAKVIHWNLCFCKNGDTFVNKRMMGWILVLTRRFIPNHSKKCFMKFHNRRSNNMLKLCFVCELCSVNKQKIEKLIHQIRFCFYIVKGCMDAPKSLIWLLEEPVSKSLSTSHVIR